MAFVAASQMDEGLVTTFHADATLWPIFRHCERQSKFTPRRTRHCNVSAVLCAARKATHWPLNTLKMVRWSKRKSPHAQEAKSGRPLTCKEHKAENRSHTRYTKLSPAIHKADNRYTQSGQPLYTKRTTAIHKADNRSHTIYTKSQPLYAKRQPVVHEHFHNS